MVNRNADNISLFGRACFAIAIIAFGVQFIIYANTLTVVAPSWPKWIAPNPIWAGLAALVLIAAGGAILLCKRARTASTTLGVIILIWAILEHGPKVIANLSNGGEWVDAFKAFAFSGGAFIVAASLPAEKNSPLPYSLFVSVGDKLLPLGRFFIGVFLIVCGIAHFIYVQYVMMLVPAWAHGPTFWTYFAGVALIAGGLGFLIKPTVRLAALWVGIMLFLWFLTLHLPRAFSALHDANEWTSVFQALGISGAAFVLSRARVGETEI